MEQTRPLIAVLDDEPQFCKALARLLKTHGFDVLTFTQGEELLASWASRLHDCLLLDLHMPGLNGFEVLERIAGRQVPVLAGARCQCRFGVRDQRPETARHVWTRAACRVA